VRFSQKRQDGSAPKFFSGFRRKHLFTTTCIEKQCTWPLRTRESIDQLSEARRSGGRASNAWRFSNFFHKNNAFLGIFQLKIQVWKSFWITETPWWKY